MLPESAGYAGTGGGRHPAAARKSQALLGRAAGVPGSERRAAQPHPGTAVALVGTGSGEYYRWRVQLGCRCITEGLTGTRPPP
jgi:hypothetical protein